MDFDKTSFSVDWFTPGDRHGPKRLSFPKSACISIDDLVSDSPLSFCFSPVDEAIPRPRTHSFADSPFERACGWSNSAPPSPFVPLDREPYTMYDQHSKTGEDTFWREPPSPGLLSIANDCASCGVDFDASCLDALDEQLLVSPVDCFGELCWAAAVHDDVTSPVLRRNTRTRARSFKCDYERPVPPPFPGDYPGSFERTRPLAAKITLPLETTPHLRLSPCESYDTSLTYEEEKTPAYILYAEPERRPVAFPVQGVQMPRRWTKREVTLTPSVESFAPSRRPSTPPRMRSCKSSQTLRAITDACASFARSNKKPPRVAP